VACETTYVFRFFQNPKSMTFYVPATSWALNVAEMRWPSVPDPAGRGYRTPAQGIVPLRHLSRAPIDRPISRESENRRQVLIWYRWSSSTSSVWSLMLIAVRHSCGLDSIGTSPQWQLACCSWVAEHDPCWLNVPPPPPLSHSLPSCISCSRPAAWPASSG